METVAEIWKYIAIVEAGVIVAITGWWIKQERPRIAAAFKANEDKLTALIKEQMEASSAHTLAMGKCSMHLKDVYSVLGSLAGKAKDLKSYTELDFNAEDFLKGDKKNE